MLKGHLTPGVYIEEVPSTIHTIAGVPTSVTAFLGTALRGPVYAPVRVHSFPDFERIFGGLQSTSEMSYAVLHFFQNGGTEAVIVRIHDGSVPDALGIKALDDVDFNLLCVPFPTTAGTLPTPARLAFWSETAIPCCAQRRAMAIIDGMPEWTSADDVHAADRSGLISPFAALYVPNLRAPDPLDSDHLRDFPPCGAVAGVIARTDAARGVWKAPAGAQAQIRGSELTFDLTDDQQSTLNLDGVNALRAFPSIGPVVWGARTTAGDSAWKYIPVRRLASYVEVSVQRGTQWAVFEPNDEDLWARLRLNIGAFMHGLFRQGAFAGVTSKEAYFVKCDRTTMTQDDVDSGAVNVLIGIAPLRPAEFVILQIRLWAGNAT